MALDFTEPEQLEKFLADKPAHWSHIIAARAALRVLPIALTHLPEKHWLLIFRACFISWAASKFPTYNMLAAAESIGSADLTAFPAARSVAISAALYAARSASASTAVLASRYAVRAVTDSVFASIIRSATRDDSVQAVFHIPQPEGRAWTLATVDAAELMERIAPRYFTELMLLPLWGEVFPSLIARRWESLAQSKAGSEYAPWINWYQALLTGNGPSADYFGPDLTLRIAQQSDEWWDQPAEKVNADIAAWLKERDSEKLIVPEPEAGITLGVAEDGRIGVVPSGVSTPTEQNTNEGILEVLNETVEELKVRLSGSNAFAVLLGDVNKYAACLHRQPLSIDQLYLRGNNLEIARVHLNKTIAAGDMPDMPVGVAAGLDSVLSTHGLLIASTHQGQVLLERSHQYENKNADIAVQRLAARKFADAIAGADRLFSDEVREEWPSMADGIGKGPYPERSAQVAMSANRNLFITIAKVVVFETLKGGLAASVVGTMMTGVTAETINNALAFLTNHLPTIRDLAAVSGSYLQWIEPLLRHLQRRMTP
jgi:hypothetical protein